MKYVFDHLAFLRGPAVDCPDRLLGSHRRLLHFACSDGVESDRLEGARDWTDAQWLRRVGFVLGDGEFARAVVDAVVGSELGRWDGRDLVLSGFDHAALDALNRKRAQGEHGKEGPEAKKNRRKPKGNPVGNPQGDGKGSHARNPIGLDGTGSEGIGKEGTGGEGTPPSPAPGGALTAPPGPLGDGEPEAEYLPPGGHALTRDALLGFFGEIWAGSHGADYRPTRADNDEADVFFAASKPPGAEEWRLACRRYVGSRKKFFSDRQHPLVLLLKNFPEFAGPGPDYLVGDEALAAFMGDMARRPTEPRGPRRAKPREDRPAIDAKRRSELGGWRHTARSFELYERDNAEWRRRVATLYPNGAPPDGDEALHAAVAKAVGGEVAA